MPIPSESVSVALSIVSGLVKLGGRIDGAIAERDALRADLILPPVILRMPPDPILMARSLTALLHRPVREGAPDPLAGDREQMTRLLADADPDEGELLGWMLKYFPDEITFETLDPAGDFARKLLARRHDLDLSDADIVRAAFYLSPGTDRRDGSLPWQMATMVVNMLAGLAVENQSLLIRDPNARQVLSAVLERFAGPEFGEIASGRRVLQFALAATINGALDAPDSLAGDKAILAGILSALAAARSTSDDGDDYVLGLIEGRGYRALVAAAIEEGALITGREGSAAIEAIVSDLLLAAAPLVRADTGGFGAFFKDHWSDLVRAGLMAAEVHGPAVLSKEGLLNMVLRHMVDALAQSDGRQFLTSDLLVGLVDTAVSAVAADPELLEKAGFPTLLRELLESVTGILATEANVFHPATLQRVVRAVIDILSTHPEILCRSPRFVADVIGPLLGALSGRPLDGVASVAVQAVLEAVAKTPALARSTYGAVIAEIARELAVRVREQGLPAQSVEAVLRASIEILAENPALVALSHEAESGIASVVAFIAGLTDSDVARLLRGPSLETVIRVVLDAVAQSPALLATGYGAAIAGVAARIRARLESGSPFDDLEVRDLLRMAAEVIATNPSLLARAGGLAAAAMDLVFDLVEELAQGKLDRRQIVALAGGVLAFLARYGRGLADAADVAAILGRLEQTLRAVLARGLASIGSGLSLRDVAAVVLAFLEQWGRNGLVDISGAAFDSIFSAAVNAATNRRSG